MTRITFTVAIILSALSAATAFSTTFIGASHHALCRPARKSVGMTMRVQDIENEAAFDKVISSSGSSLVVVDYSTTWCGPCKVIAKTFGELSDKYPEAVFLKVIGDSSKEATKLMKREGIKSVPAFHYFVDGERVDIVNGANAEAIEAAIRKHSS